MSGLSMYEQVMGNSFAQLPVAVQRFHRLSGHKVLNGWVDTQAPSTAVGKLLALCLGTPMRATSGAIRFELDAAPDEETWTRHFPSKKTTSQLCRSGGFVVEHLGAARLTFGLYVVEGRLAMQLKKLYFLGVPCPGWLLPRIVAEESGHGDQLHFTVSASLPVVGRVASYSGHLVVSDNDCS